MRFVTYKFATILWHICTKLTNNVLLQMYQEGPSEIARTGLTFEQLQRKISFAEKTKEEALQAKESLNALMHRMEKKYVFISNLKRKFHDFLTLLT